MVIPFAPNWASSSELGYTDLGHKGDLTISTVGTVHLSEANPPGDTGAPKAHLSRGNYRTTPWSLDQGDVKIDSGPSAVELPQRLYH